MSAEVVEAWLQSGRNVVINRLSLKPIEHALLAGKPLSSQKGQAEAFFLIDDDGEWWILKKFHNTSNLDRSYLNKIRPLLPKDDGFLCGTERQVLSSGILQKIVGCHYDRDLDQWLDGTILMPRIKGFDWSALADEIRDGSIRVDQLQRFTLCKNLTELIELLETGRCSHRDLSCGNVFVDTYTWQVSLIDFDSFYHPRLVMPRGTTCGTTGYTAHHAWSNGKLDARGTWCEKADRYALTLLNVEFLLMAQGTGITGEGGIFDQDELRKQSGNKINSVIGQLKTQYPLAAQFLESTIRSSNFSECPSPQDWSTFYNTIPGLMAPSPNINDLSQIPPEYFTRILSKCKPAARLWPPPNLQEMPARIPTITKTSKVKLASVDLPSDPLANRKLKKRKL
jgi:serine/threonine protein kinase